jgi:hypothetical protein
VLILDVITVYFVNQMETPSQFEIEK